MTTTKKPRDLTQVIDQIVLIEPSLKEALAPVRQSALFRAPELMGGCWRDAAHVLRRDVPIGSPNELAIQTVFNGSRTLFWKGEIRVPDAAACAEVEGLGFTVLREVAHAGGFILDVRGPYEAMVAIEPFWGRWLWTLVPVLEGAAS